MAIILDGNSKIGAHVWSELENLICLMHQNAFFQKPVLLHMCATWSELPSHKISMIHVQILSLSLWTSKCKLRAKTV